MKLAMGTIATKYDTSDHSMHLSMWVDNNQDIMDIFAKKVKKFKIFISP